MKIVAIVVVVLGLFGLVTWALNDVKDSALAVQLVMVVGGLLYLALR